MMLGRTKRLRILDMSTTNRAAGRPSASRKGVCHDRRRCAQGGQGVFLQAGGGLFQADSTCLGPDGTGLPLGSSSTLPQDDCGRGPGRSLSRGHDLSPADQPPMADAGLVCGPVRPALGQRGCLGAATGERKAAAMDRGHRHDLPFHDVGADGKPDPHVEAAESREEEHPPARLSDGAGADRPRCAAAFAAEELLHGGLLPETQAAFSDDDRPGSRHDPRTARAGRRGRSRHLRQRLRRRRDPQGVPKTPFSRGFSARSESGSGPHAGPGRGDGLGRPRGGLDAALDTEGVCPARTRNGQRRPRLRPSATRRQLASQKNEAAVRRRGAKRRSPNWATV